MNLFKVVVAGGRYFNDYDLLKNKLDRLLTNYLPHVEIVSGGAPGADYLGERYAAENGLKLKIFPADWATYGKAAGPIRNHEMSCYCDGVVLFWDGTSRGTKNMMDCAKKQCKPTRVIRY